MNNPSLNQTGAKHLYESFVKTPVFKFSLKPKRLYLLLMAKITVDEL